MAATKTRWFGNLLDWQYNPQQAMHCAWHQGRTHYLTKVDRDTADANRINRGWCLWYPEPHDGWYGFGPSLGQHIDTARRAAEVWIVGPYSDMHVSADGPGLPSAISGAGAAAWDDLVVYPDNERAQFTLAPEHDDAIALIRPVFLGAGSAATVRWRAFTPADDLLSSGDTWRAMFRDLRQQLGN